MTAFTYFGEELHYSEEFPDFEWSEFHAARLEDELSEVDARGHLLRLALACIVEADRGRFRKISRAHHAKLEDWMKVVEGRVAVVAERPTGQPTDSSDGLSDTEQTSDSEPVATVTSIAQPEPRPVQGAVALAVARSQTG